MRLKKVIIVEDDAILTLVQKQMVSRLGYEVVGTASSGEEVIHSVQKMNPDIMLIDVQLAGELDGIATVRKLRERGNETPVIFISGCIDTELLSSAKEVGYIDFLRKPVDIMELKANLKKAGKYSGKTYAAASG